MPIKLAGLGARLEKPLPAVVHLFGAETLLVEEALDRVRRVAREQGFGERIRYTLGPGFDWNQLLASGASQSLFAERKIIEMRMPGGKPGVVGSKALVEYAEGVKSAEAGKGGDTLLVLLCGALDRNTQGSKWFKVMEGAGFAVECPTMPSGELPGWIARRMRSKGLDFEPEAAERLSQFVEGNLLAAAQEIDLLALLTSKEGKEGGEGGRITAARVEGAIADHARFTVYTFADACLAGKAVRCVRVLQSLRRNQVEPILVLWSLTQETRKLCQLAAGLERGGGNMRAQELFQRYGIWRSRGALVNAALRRLPLARWEWVHRRLARADLMLKGRVPMRRQNIWEEIESIGLAMCGQRGY